MEIRAKTIAEAHGKVCREIFENGDELVTEDDELTFEYPEPVMIHIEKPNHPNKISSFNNLKGQAIEEYVKQFLTFGELDFAYTYGNRMLDYPVADMFDDKLLGNGRGDGFNQIEWIIDMLIKEPNTRRAVAMIRYPDIDCYSKNPPCLTTVQFFIRNGAINLVTYFRSNDMLSAWGNNAYALHALQNYVGEEIFKRTKNHNCVCGGNGTLTTISANAHMYFKRDAEEMKRMKAEVYSCL